MEKKIEHLDLTKPVHKAVTIPVAWIAAVFIAGWFGKPWIAEVVGLQTVEAAEVVNQKIDLVSTNLNALTTEIRIDRAFVMERVIKEDLVHHLERPEDNPQYRADIRALEDRVKLAGDYKRCLMDERPNCNTMKDQLLR